MVTESLAVAEATRQDAPAFEPLAEPEEQPDETLAYRSAPPVVNKANQKIDRASRRAANYIESV